jgi:DNA-binding MarR family transcriptional regulator
MTDQVINALDPIFREADLRRGIELLYFGYSHLTRTADARLDTQGLGRAHHRALYFIARQPDMPVGDLLKLLNVTKQSLNRVLNDLIKRDMVEMLVGNTDRRQRLLRLTGAGASLEAALFSDLRATMERGYQAAGPQSIAAFWQVLEHLVPVEERGRILALQKG